MNLHICTISHRNNFLQQIYNTIPRYTDIIWHIARAHNNPVPQFLKADSRIQVHELTCDDIDTSFKMNYIFQQILEKDPDSYFCLLDDDTEFFANMYHVYETYKSKQFMVIGEQLDKEGRFRLPATLPYECAIDSGNVLCHSSVLQEVKWPDEHWDDKFHADYEFWNKCFQYFGLKRTDLIQRPVSLYNIFSDKEDTLDYVR